jgi:hypothetical protein
VSDDELLELYYATLRSYGIVLHRREDMANAEVAALRAIWGARQSLDADICRGLVPSVAAVEDCDKKEARLLNAFLAMPYNLCARNIEGTG